MDVLGQGAQLGWSCPTRARSFWSSALSPSQDSVFLQGLPAPVLREVKTHFSFRADMVSVEGTSLPQSAACLWTSGNSGEGLGSRSFLRRG